MSNNKNLPRRGLLCAGIVISITAPALAEARSFAARDGKPAREDPAHYEAVVVLSCDEEIARVTVQWSADVKDVPAIPWALGEEVAVKVDYVAPAKMRGVLAVYHRINS